MAGLGAAAVEAALAVGTEWVAMADSEAPVLAVPTADMLPLAGLVVQEEAQLG